MKRSLLAALLLPLIGHAQTTEFGNVNVVQNDAGNATTSVTVTKGPGSSPNMSIRTGSTKADYNVAFGNANDFNTGVLVAAISENGRNNNAVGETIGTFYTTVGVELNSTSAPSLYYLALFRAPNAEEQNQNVACAFLPYSQWLGGTARNGANGNGGTTDTLTASPGINLGAQFTTAGGGVFGLNLTTINASYTSQNGILLVNHLKNEDNYAAPFANGDGSFTMHVRDNGSTGTVAAPATEQDPIAFVYLHTSDVGTKFLKAMGRVNSDASTDVTGGTFTAAKGGTGQWFLTIPGMSPATGTLIVSPEGGATNNVDNIVSYQWDAANSHYVVESRDIVSTTAAPALEDGATSGEDMFSFAFFESPVVPTVAITSPVTGSSVITGTAFNIEADAADANGTITQVEFLRNGVVVDTDTAAPFSFNQSALSVGTYSFTARATDNDGFATTSTPVSVSVTLDPGNLPANTALWFDGVNDYVTMGTALDLGVGGPPTNGMTLECWFRQDGAGTTTSSGTGGVTCVPLFGKGRGEADGDNRDCDYMFGITAGGILVADFETYPATGLTAGQNYPITATNTPIVSGDWHHAAVTYDGATATWTMYLDGAPVGTATAPAGALPRYDSIQHFGIGTAMTSTGATQGFFNGIIDEVRVWNYARSGAEIASTRDVSVSSSPGLVGRYGLNEGIGTSTDSSTGTSSGTLTNGPLWIQGATLVTNDPPAVAITAPVDNTTINAPASFSITATASDTDGTVSKVEFFQGATKLGEDTTVPYSFDVSGLAQGDYSYTARATDNFGAFTNSAVITVHVLPPVTTPPTVSIASPIDGATFLAPATITVSANATDSDGSVVKVEFFNGATKLGEDTTAPYAFDWTNVAVGSYSLTAKATDNMTATTTSTAIAVNVIVNQSPSVTLTSPADLATNTGAGGTVTLSASVSDPESQPMNVTFYGKLKSPPVGPDFTLVTLPDTQFYSENTGGTRLANFTSQTNWIVANRTTLNIPFVAHMGDMVQNGDSVQQEWINADSAMDIIEDPITTLLTHGIPWGGAPGNHDQQPIGSPDGASTYWNQYFGTSRWAGRPYWGGNYSTNNDNNYQLFSASGLDFIIVNLEYRPSANQAVLDWADALLKAHPTRRAIITSHWLIGTGNPAAWGGHGQAVYDNLKDNPNLFLMLCGHIHGEGQRSDTFEGRTVHTVLQDYQSRSNGGDSWLRYFVFSPANNTITARTLQTTTVTHETDADSQFILPYTMGAGSAAWVPLGTVSASGGTATLDWTGLAGSTEYEWYAAVSDGTNNIGSNTRSFATASNAAPTVSLTSPAEASTVVLPAQVSFAATAADSDGTVAKVEFFAGATKVGEDSTAPFAFDWTAISGTYALTAVATDSQGATATSSIVYITVTNPANVPPTVSITAPATGFSTENNTLAISATAADTDGVVTKVEFYEGSTKLGEDTTSPFTYNWTGITVGTYSLTAVATDNDGGVTTSAVVSVTFTPPGNFLGSYTQNFDSMGTTGTTLPGTWSVKNAASGTTNNTWTTTIAAGDVAAMINASGALTATTTPSGTNNNGFNAADLAGNTANRVLASSPTSVAGIAFQLLLTNGSGAPIDELKISYETLRYTSVATVGDLPGYWLFYSLDGGTTWSNASAFNPTITTVPNSTGTTVTAETTLALGADWMAGSQLLLRWVDDNATQTSPDQIIGLDNVSIQQVDKSILMLTEVNSNQSAGKPVGANDFWELTNLGSTAKDISGYSWHDSGRSASAAAVYQLPVGTTIVPGESVVFTNTDPAVFRAWWGLPGTVQVFQATAPGLGQNDGVSFFDNTGTELFFFSYAAGGFVMEDGSSSDGTHAGPSGSANPGIADSQSLIWVPTSGVVAPRYTAATGSNYATFSAVSPATDIGSPGTVGVVGAGVSVDDISVTEGNSGIAVATFTVTRTNNEGTFSVGWATSDGTAAAPVDYTTASGTVNFTAGGAAAATFEVTVQADTVVEPDEIFTVTLSNLVNTTATAQLTDAVATATIANDDLVAPTITSEPSSVTIASGNSTTLSVTATGTPTPTYQWYVGPRSDISNPVSGETLASFTTPVLTATTTYWVRVTNSQNFVDSQAATVTVDTSGVFSSINFNITEPNTGVWNPAGVTVGGTTFVNLGLQGVGRVPASAVDPVTGESIGSVSDLQISGWKKNTDGSYSGVFHLLPDRGYNSGSVYSNYAARINDFSFTFTPYTATAATTLQNQIAMNFAGSRRFTYDHDGNSGTAPIFTTGLLADGKATLFGSEVPATTTSTTQSDGSFSGRLTVDAEGLILDTRPGKVGSGWVSDEYGPYIYHFSADGSIDGLVQIPAALVPHGPAGTVNFSSGTTGRRENQGMEGIAQSPDGTKLFALLQSATLQDSGSGNQNRYNTRLLVYDISSSDTPTDPAAQYVIQLPRIDTSGSTTNGTAVDRTGAQSAILALNDHQILILSRDGNGRGATGAPVFKSVLLAELNGATDIDGIYDAEGSQVSPAAALLPSITPMTWKEALNMIGKVDASTLELAKFNLNINAAPGDINSLSEKWEALSLVSANDAANPNDYFLFIGNDNDFMSGSGKHMDASGTIQSYAGAIENDTVLLAYRVRFTGPDNQPPFVASAVEDQTGTAGSPFSFSMPVGTFADPENQALTYSATLADGGVLPAWLSFEPATRTFSGTPGAGDAGVLEVRVTATDSGTPALFKSTTFAVDVQAGPTNFTLQLLHFGDGEAGLLASQTAPNLAALVDAFDDDHANTLILSGGDNFIPSPFLNAGTDPALNAVASVGKTAFARPDIAIHNLIGVEASAIGNHEWDLGTAVFTDAIRADGAWVGAQFPSVSANLDYSLDSAALGRFNDVMLDGATTAVPDAGSRKGRLVPMTVIAKGTEKIGVVGVTTQLLRTISSPSGTFAKGFPAGTIGADDMNQLATVLQPYINELIAEGINKVVLLAHLQQLSNERLLATKLTGVDIIVAAGSNTRLGDADDVAVAFPGHAATFADTYPILTAGADTKPVLIVNTDNEYSYLGRLVAEFDTAGEIIVGSLASRVTENGAYAATAANVAAAWGVAESALGTTAFAAGTKGAAVKQVTDAVQSVINAKDGQVYGYTAVYLEGERAFVRSEETNLGNLTADANQDSLRRIIGGSSPIVSIKNGGGIRAQIGAVSSAGGSSAKLPPVANPSVGKSEGGISQLDIENALRFNNRLMAFDTTPAGLKAILEHGVASYPNQGRFPQIGGVAFAWNPARSAGSRITSITLMNDDGSPGASIYKEGPLSAAVTRAAPASITVITLNFMANDGDGYPMKVNGSNFRYVLDNGTLGPVIIDEALNFTVSPQLPANALGEQRALSDFLTSRYGSLATAYRAADTTMAQDQRIQNLSQRTDSIPPMLTADSDGDGLTDLEEELYGLDPNAGLRVGETLSLNLGALGASGSTYRLVGKLPLGLTFNTATGTIGGQLLGTPGNYQLQIQELQGRVVINTFWLNLTVAPVPALLLGGYQVLLEDATGAPRGLMELTLTKAGSWTGSLSYIGQTKRSTKGVFALTPGTTQVSIPVIMPATTKLPAATVTVTLDSASPLASATYSVAAETGTGRGARLANSTTSTPITQRLTMVLDSGIQDGIAYPAGMGTLRGTCSTTGALAMKGLLGDAKAVTLGMKLTVTGQALVWTQPYLNKQSYLGGVVLVDKLGQPLPFPQRLDDGMMWFKATDTKELAYDAGFAAPLEVSALSSRWTAPATSTLLETQLGLTGSALDIIIDGAGLDSAAATAPILPTSFLLSSKFALTVGQPVNSVQWKGGVLKVDGGLTGSFTLTAGAANLAGPGALTAVLLQNAAFGNTVGGGLVKVPVSGKKGAYRTASAVFEK